MKIKSMAVRDLSAIIHRRITPREKYTGTHEMLREECETLIRKTLKLKKGQEIKSWSDPLTSGLITHGTQLAMYCDRIIDDITASTEWWQAMTLFHRVYGKEKQLYIDMKCYGSYTDYMGIYSCFDYVKPGRATNHDLEEAVAVFSLLENTNLIDTVPGDRQIVDSCHAEIEAEKAKEKQEVEERKKARVAEEKMQDIVVKKIRKAFDFTDEEYDMFKDMCASAYGWTRYCNVGLKIGNLMPRRAK